MKKITLISLATVLLSSGLFAQFDSLLWGCTDSTAINYNPAAIYDDGSCYYDSTGNGDIYGCTDFFALNFNPFATIDDGSCYYDSIIVYGCTDPLALNYNPWATIDDGSCYYTSNCDSGQVLVELYVCTFQNGYEVGLELIGDNGDTVFSQIGFNNLEIAYFDLCLDFGVCYTVNMSNNTNTGWYGGYFWVNLTGTQMITDYLDDNLNFESTIFSIDGTCGEIYGCTDPAALNYNPIATADDGSCYYQNDTLDVYGCTDFFALNYNPFATIEDGSCIYDSLIYGCTDPLALNYNPWATLDDGSCFYDSTGTGNCTASFNVIEIDSVLNVVYIVNNSNASAAATYFWDFGDGTSSTDAYPTHVYSQDGIYLVCLTLTDVLDPLGNILCTSTYCDTVGFFGILGGGQLEFMNGFTINVIEPGSTGIGEMENLITQELYPNPTRGELNVNISLKTADRLRFRITDVSGRTIMTEERSLFSGNNHWVIELQALNNGMYFFITESENIFQTRTLIIQR